MPPEPVGRRQQAAAMVAFVAGTLVLVLLCIAIRHFGVRVP